MTHPDDNPRLAQPHGASRASAVGGGLPADAAGAVAEACRAVLDGYAAALSPLDAVMLERLVRLGDLIPTILADEARLTLAFGALRQVLAAFDSAENRDAERQPKTSVALQAVYRLLGLAWPARP